MAHVTFNKQKTLKKWAPILEKCGITSAEKQDWMSEYSEYHSLYENVAYSTLGNLSGMGAVVAPQPSGIPGQTGFGTPTTGSAYGQGGTAGSGDYGQQLLPVAMKVAAQTIGLELVSVKPTAGPRIDLMYIDYRYDDGPLDSADYNPMYFKLNHTDTAIVDSLIAEIRILLKTNGVRETRGGLTGRLFLNLTANTAANRPAGSVTADTVTIEPTDTKEGVVEFVGFSRIDGLPMFRTYRTTNAVAQGSWKFNKTSNTFAESEMIKSAFAKAAGTSGKVIDPATLQIGLGVDTLTSKIVLEHISTMEDQLPGFVRAGGKNAMTREKEENTYAGVIAPNVATKSVQVGSITISSALKLTEIEDIKSQTGIDIVQKLESVLINELSQTISREIVDRLFLMGETNRASAPKLASGATIFDFDVDAYLSGNAPGGETSQSIQRKLITKVFNASSFIATEGRIGQATFMVTNGTLAAVLREGAAYTLQPADASFSSQGQLINAGKVNGISIYVDPYMTFNDNRILLGRKNAADQPGVIFVPYLMAQSIKMTSEATGAPKMLLRSRYAVTEVGYFPHKQYMTM